MNNLFYEFSILATKAIHFIIRESMFTSLIFMIFLPFGLLLKKRIPRLVHGLWLLVLIRLFLPLQFSLPYSVAAYLPFQDVPLSFGVEDNMIEDIEISGQNTLPFSAENVRADINIIYPILFMFLIISWIVLLIYYLKLNTRIPILIKKSSLIRKHGGFRIITSDHSYSPFSFGLLNPVIYIPQNLLNTLTEHDINIIITHELAHIKNRDQFWVWMDSLIKIVYFFNPLVWWIVLERQKLREWIADDNVLVQKKIKSQDYGRCLISLIKFNLFDSHAFQWAPGIGHRRSHIKHRITRLKGDHLMRKIPSFVWVMVLFTAGWLLLPMTRSVESIAISAEKPSMNESMDPVFINPLITGSISSRYGMRMHPIYKEKRLHQGIDLKAKLGTPIRAAAEGVVLKVIKDHEPGKGYGINLIIQHANGMKTRYCQLNKILVEEGEQVNAKTVIAEVGSSGMSTGPHLHFELIKDGDRINPEKFIQF